jgi:choline dehydrogenase
MKSNAEVVVIGGGSGGGVIAARLAEAGVETVLIEAGPDYGPFSAHVGKWPTDLIDAHALALSHDWGYNSGPVAGRESWSFERAKVIGGCSSHNGAIAAVGHVSNYDGWVSTNRRLMRCVPCFPPPWIKCVFGRFEMMKLARFINGR